MLLKIIKHQSQMLTKFIYTQRSIKVSKYQLLINESEKVGIIHEMNPKALMYYSQTIVDVYKI